MSLITMSSMMKMMMKYRSDFKLSGVPYEHL